MAAVGAVVALSSFGCASLKPFRQVVAEHAGEFVTVSGQRVHVVTAGPQNAPPVVLLHGFGASSFAWRKVQPLLSSPAGGGPGAATYRTIAIDLNAFGYTERTSEAADYTLDGQAALVLGVLDAFGIESAHLAGHSYGGALAQWIAAHHKERVRSLLLLDAASPVYASERRSRSASLRPIASLFLRLVALKPAYVRRSLEGGFHDRSLVTDALVRGYLEPLKVEGSTTAYRLLSQPSDAEPKSFDPSTLRVPTLAIWGADDTLIPVDAARRTAGRIPDVRFVELPDCGHNPHEEKPDETAQTMRAFLLTVPSRP
jgi:pimeloyl-ACP methyl ester carboxylesterase